MSTDNVVQGTNIHMAFNYSLLKRTADHKNLQMEITNHLLIQMITLI